MATSIFKNSALLVVLLVLLAARCTKTGDHIRGIPITHTYDSCDASEVYFGDMITIGDPGERFFISLPYSWDIRESYNDSVYGIYASNFLSIPIEVKDRLAVLITGYETELSQEEYFLNETKTLKKDDAVQLLETGTITIDEQNCQWLMFRNTSEHQIYHTVVYLKNSSGNDIYLLQSMTFDTENYKDRLCHLKKIIKSFEIEER